MVWWSGGLLVATWLLLDSSTAGFSCLSNPCLYGICMDDLNSSFTCYCIDGYTGVHCQTNWDECWSSPCFNGGFCQDGVASYNCSCPDGFVGDLCEENVDECNSNPCHNNGTCVDAANSYSCQCAPGYSGTHCELDIAVCNSTEESEGIRCHNGGVCLEGPGIQFSCFCTPGWTGKLCEIPIDECASNPCQNGAVCIDLPASYSCACLFGFTGRDCDLVLSMCPANLCDNDALCLVEEENSVCYCVPDYHGDRCQFQYNECLLGPGCKNGGTCIDGVDSFSCSCPPDLTGHFCECLILDDSALDCSYVRPSTTTALPTTTMSSTSTTLHTSSYVPTSQTFFTTTEFFTTFLETSMMSHSTSGTSTKMPSTAEIVTEDSSPTTTPVEETTEPSQEESTSFSDTTTELLVTSDTLDLITTKPTESSGESESVSPASETTDEPIDLDTVGDSDANDEYKTTQFIITTEETKPISLEPREPTSGLLNVSSTTDIQTTTMLIDTTTVDSLDCSGRTFCLNGGTCYITADGKMCKCRQGWIGFKCEEREAIEEAAFTGKSYLTHRLANQSSTEVSVVIRTLAPTGLIIHANTSPYMHMAVFLHEGLLKFVFTCGIQTMLFSELHERVNTGFPLNITAKLEVEGPIGEQHCSASLGVNDSLAMSGEQRALAAPLPDWRHHQASLHLGGVPPQRRPAVNIPVTLGVTGCMQGLQVNGVPRNIFGDAVDVFEVSQCSSLACLSNPCHSAATCVEHGDSWACLCPSGLIGVTCEKSVCLNNPCQFGGTCSPFPGTGFICLCPFGKHGLYCQKDLEIGHPLYSSSVRGLASFSAYPIPGALHHSFEIRFRFTTQMMEQVALLLFIGQDHSHDATSDHLAVSFIKGYIVLTWNLGSGPRRIFTPRSVPAKTGSVHVVKFGRVGRKAWLQVDNLDNVTGSSPGQMTELNTQHIVYIGGHKFRNLSGLPHDLPLHTGFSGCVYGVEWRIGRVSVPISQVRAVTVLGRNVGQCGTSHCHNTTCLNGGACIDHGATFTCLCKDGWFGPVCALRFNPCDSTRNNCSSGATCVPLETGYECDCPFGKVGKYCETEEVLTDISLTGRRSFIAVPSAELHLLQICVEFELRPAQDRGLVFYTGHLQGQTFISIALHGGILELRLKTIGGERRSGEVLVVRSGRVLSLATWHLVRAGRYGNRVFLSVDGAVTTTTLLQGETILASKHPIFLGGVLDLSDLPPGAMTGLPVPLTGCVRRLVLNWHPVPLTMAHVLTARNVADCDGTACGGDVCLNSGTCWLDTSLKPHCTCTQEFMGEKCESPVSCLELPCENNGMCVTNQGAQPECQCPVGWEGPFCSKVLAQGAAHFDEDSYLLMESSSSLMKRGQDNSFRRKDIEFLFVNFSTVYTRGMIIWSAQDDEYIGAGIEDGHLQVAWAWKGVEPSIVLLPEPLVADGNWHLISINLNKDNVTILCDRTESVTLPSRGHRPILTNGVFHLGGFPNTKNTFAKTKGIFKESFRGCVQEVAWSGHSSVTNFSKYIGENIKSCTLF